MRDYKKAKHLFRIYVYIGRFNESKNRIKCFAPRENGNKNENYVN